MAKKKAAEGTHGGKRWSTEGVSAQQLRNHAIELEQIAQTMTQAAEDMVQLGADQMNIAMGNFHYSTRKLNGWLATQLMPKLLKKASEKGRAFSFGLNTEAAEKKTVKR